MVITYKKPPDNYKKQKKPKQNKTKQKTRRSDCYAQGPSEWEPAAWYVFFVIPFLKSTNEWRNEWISWMSDDVWYLAVCCHYPRWVDWATSFWTKPFQLNVNGKWQVLKGTLQGKKPARRVFFFFLNVTFSQFVFFLEWKRHLSTFPFSSFVLTRVFFFKEF